MATGDQTLINFPRDTTLQDIAQSLQTIAFTQAANLENISNWDQISGLSRNGYAQKIFNYGDQFVEKWTDTAASTEYEYPWRVNHFENVELENDEVVPGMYLQAHYAHPFGVQFSQNRAFLRCPNGLQAGTYNITLGATWGSKDAQKDTTWQFTLTQDVPVGGCLNGFYQMPDVAANTWKVTSYAADRITKIETVSVLSGSEGTALGTMQMNTRNGDLNSMQETGYGWNRWKTSALRQYLNSDQPKGKWWTPQDDWDVAPDQLATKDGFLRGLPENMLRAIKTVKVVTYTNTVQDGGEADVTYDKVFLPSLEQMYYNPQIAGEGNAHEYWKRRSGSKTKLPQYQALPRMITYAVENHTSPQNVRLRSAYRGSASSAWYVLNSGSAYTSIAALAHRFAPFAVI
jgi:hypothetical protein